MESAKQLIMESTFSEKLLLKKNFSLGYFLSAGCQICVFNKLFRVIQFNLHSITQACPQFS